MKNLRFTKASIASLLALTVAACSGGMRSIPQAPGAGPASSNFQRGAPPGAVAPDIVPHAKIVVSPASLAFLATGTTAVKSVTVTETGYTGTFTEVSTCKNIATAAPTSGKGPKLTVKITPSGAGSCSITFQDSSKNKTALPITVTLVAFKLSAASISPASKSVTAKITKGGTGSLTTTLPTCTAGCTVNGPPSNPGSDSWTLTIFDKTGGTGNVLATGSITSTVVSGHLNTINVTLGKVPKTFSWGSLPSATAGSTSGFPATIALTVKDADGNAIVGSYSTSVSVTDNDTSSVTQGSSVSVNGGAFSHAVSLTASTDVLKLNYGGLAIAPVTLTAAATGATSLPTTFAPTLKPIVYSGPLNGSNQPEIDLYNPTNGQPGFSAQFSDTQPGWYDGSTFTNNFTYATSTASGNNCSSYTITPASGKSNAYTVSVGTTPVAGTCTLTVTGGAAQQATVLLTYSTTGIGIGLRHEKP